MRLGACSASTTSPGGHPPALLRALSALAARHGSGEALFQAKSHAARQFTTGLPALDAIAPNGGFARGAVHELLTQPPHRPPLTVAAFLASCAARQRPEAAIVWCESPAEGGVYPPALAAMGVPLERLLLLRAWSFVDEVWAAAECAACRGVAATVASFHARALSRVQARRLQLAAERGGGVGLLLRPLADKGQGRGAAGAAHYAAATRWLVRPVRGDATVRRWEIRLVHGHGGRIGQGVILEVCRETNLVRASETLADRSAPAKVKALIA